MLGVAALSSSFPALFVLASGGFALAVHFIVKRDWRSGVKLGSIAGIWLVSFVLMYSVSWRETSGNRSLSEYWQITFMPLPPWRDLAVVHRHIAQFHGVSSGFAG